MINKWVMYSGRYSLLNRPYLILGEGYDKDCIRGMHFTKIQKAGSKTLTTGVGFQAHLKETQVKCVLAPEELGVWLDE